MADQYVDQAGASAVTDVPGGDRVQKKLEKMHVAKRTVRRVLDEVEMQAADEQHANDLLVALSNATALLPAGTRESLASLLQSNCVVDVLSIKAKKLTERFSCFA